ncbi:MAG: polyphosphate polymerase domain-containing protein [Filifactor alocis]|nr:polyphosphate polymerase domain-containing protein [Filifactor alocis]
MNEVLRQERKFLIGTQTYHQLSQKFSEFMHLDEYSQGDGYRIRSLYFDSIDDVDWHEKQDGIELRRKIRLRNYGPQTDFALLEMKQKQGPNQKKRSLKLSRSDAEELIEGNTSVLLKYPGNFAAECYARIHMHCYRPKAVVEYHRQAFVAKENRIRITFDRHIVGTESQFNIFSNDLLQSSLLDPGLTVLEVKYNGFLLTYIKTLLEEINSSELSISKYCLGRAVSKHYHF